MTERVSGPAPVPAEAREVAPLDIAGSGVMPPVAAQEVSMATSGDPHLATSGDFFMAMDIPSSPFLSHKTPIPAGVIHGEHATRTRSSEIPSTASLTSVTENDLLARTVRQMPWLLIEIRAKIAGCELTRRSKEVRIYRRCRFASCVFSRIVASHETSVSRRCGGSSWLLVIGGDG
jgi:hypothetical protein